MEARTTCEAQRSVSPGQALKDEAAVVATGEAAAVETAEAEATAEDGETMEAEEPHTDLIGDPSQTPRRYG